MNCLHKGVFLPLSGLSRRCFLKNCGKGLPVLLCLGLELTACNSSSTSAPTGKIPLGQLSTVGPGLTIFKLERLAIHRDSAGLAAMSLVCTHQDCFVHDEPSGEAHKVTFVCPCHGSRFDRVGKVLLGPAQKDLPWFELQLDSKQILWVDFGARVSADWRLKI